jgi:hypothetical protein
MPITRTDFDDIVGTKPLESFTEEDLTNLMGLLNGKNEGEDVSIVFSDFQGSGTTKENRKKFLEGKFGITDDIVPVSGTSSKNDDIKIGRWKYDPKNPNDVLVRQGNEKFEGEQGGKRRSRKRRSSKKKRKNKKSKKSRKAKKSRKSRK